MNSIAIAIFLVVISILLFSVIVYLLLQPQYDVARRHTVMPHPVMPRFGPYWAHGGQTNSDILY